MSRRAAAFTQADVARALRAAEQVAPGKLRVRVSREGEIIVEPAETPPSPPTVPDRAPVALLREPRL